MRDEQDLRKALEETGTFGELQSSASICVAREEQTQMGT